MIKYLFHLLLLALPYLSFAQSYTNHGGGAYASGERKACLSPVERNKIQQDLDQNIRSLIQAGKISAPLTKRSRPAFGWPLKVDERLNWNSYWMILNYVDQRRGIGLEDYNCGADTYDGHRGVDFMTFPFPWYLYAFDMVSVVAAEAGHIISKQDGFSDQSCTWGSNLWNAVYVRHDDGSVAWYGHLKIGYLTQKEVGERVEKGEFLGYVASSGRSSGPHLHFEVYDESRDLIDPYSGNCNQTNPESWWEEQKNDKASNINAVLTHSAIPIQKCPLSAERTFFKNEFASGDTLLIAAYLINQRSLDQLEWTITQPDGQIWDQWNQTLLGFEKMSYWWWKKGLPADAQSGNWEITVKYKDNEAVHNFKVENLTTSVASFNEIDLELFPIPTRDVLNIRGLGTQPATFRLYDTQGGQILERFLDGNSSISTTGISSGVYIAFLELNGKSYQQRVVILK
ncbi:MAG: M23 family metallopeptidase [Bacteroidota bacterium]